MFITLLCRATYDVHNLTVMHMTFILCVTRTCSGLEAAPGVGCVWISPCGGRPGSESHSLGRRGQARQWSDTGLCSKVGGLSYQVAGNGRWEVRGYREKWQAFYIYHHTVDREIFALKIIHVKNFCVIKFSQFLSIHKIFLTVDDCSMDECQESSWPLVYYQVSGQPGIPGCSHQSDIYLGECGLARDSLFTDHRRVILFFAC